jgi:ribokinase
VVVVGSCNLDQVLTGSEFPGPGLTVSADGLFEEPGGKGLNQALAAARAGARVSFVGATGDDGAAATTIRAVLTAAGVDVAHLRSTPGPSGRAVIFVDRRRENRIVLVPGANATVTELTPPERELVRSADVVLLQLELPLSVVLEAAELAAGAGVRVALTPAPVAQLSARLLQATSILYANEAEALALTGAAELVDAMDRLFELVPELVVTRGALGSDYADRSGARIHADALPVTAVDTTAAGDVYAGVFTVARARGAAVADAMRWASAAAAITVQRPGTSGAVPTAVELADLG